MSVSRCLIAIASALLSPILLLGQENYQSGYVVLADGDTARGFIDYRIWSTSPDSLIFRSTEGKVSYSPVEILGFGIGERIAYRSRWVEFDSLADLPRPSFNSEPIFKRKNVFLRLLSEGEISLYSLDNTSHVHFFVEKNKEIIELIHHPFYREVQGYQRKLYNSKFLYQLNQLFGDCNGHVPEKAHYQEEILKDLIEKYHSCRNLTSKRYAREKSKVLYGLSGAGTLVALQPDFEIGVGYQFGVFLSISFPSDNYKRSFVIEPMINTYPTLEVILPDRVEKFSQMRTLKTSLIYANKLNRNPKYEILLGVTMAFGISGDFSAFYSDGRKFQINSGPSTIGGVMVGSSFQASRNLSLELRYDLTTGFSFQMLSLSYLTSVGSISEVSLRMKVTINGRRK